MSKQYLLVGEVDKIQSFVFRSARRREVVGASYLLRKFCEDVKKEYANSQNVDVLTSAGGSFRLVFDSAPDAYAAEQALRRDFAARVGGAITTVVVNDTGKQDGESLLIAGNRCLREAKTAGDVPIPVWHLPIQAVCASCGVELAIAHRLPNAAETIAKYLCATCIAKGDENWFRLFDAFRNHVNPHGNYKSPLPAKAAEPETYASGWDDWNRVAYLLADGNRMGELFTGCSPRKQQQLSDAIDDITSNALAEAVGRLLGQDVPGASYVTMPCLPLIMGGDDLFVMMPAPWAYDVSIRFCKTYEAGMKAVFDSEPIEVPSVPLTIGVAVVICKASFPYKLAHEYGDDLLGSVKDEAKATNHGSMLAVHHLVSGDATSTDATQGISPRVHSLSSAKKLLRWRYKLNDVPSRVRERIREDIAHGRGSDFSRVREVSPHTAELLEKALTDLEGDANLLELFENWDFAFDLDELKEAGYLKKEEGAL